MGLWNQFLEFGSKIHIDTLPNLQIIKIDQIDWFIKIWKFSIFRFFGKILQIFAKIFQSQKFQKFQFCNFWPTNINFGYNVPILMTIKVYIIFIQHIGRFNEQRKKSKFHLKTSKLQNPRKNQKNKNFVFFSLFVKSSNMLDKDDIYFDCH